MAGGAGYGWGRKRFCAHQDREAQRVRVETRSRQLPGLAIAGLAPSPPCTAQTPARHPSPVAPRRARSRNPLERAVGCMIS